eukprot:755871-Prorocentrum_lima.AAC.1
MTSETLEALICTVVSLLEGHQESRFLCAFVDRDCCKTFRAFLAALSAARLQARYLPWAQFAPEVPLMDARLLEISPAGESSDVEQANAALGETLYPGLFVPKAEVESDSDEEWKLPFADAEDTT